MVVVGEKTTTFPAVGPNLRSCFLFSWSLQQNNVHTFFNVHKLFHSDVWKSRTKHTAFQTHPCNTKCVCSKSSFGCNRIVEKDHRMYSACNPTLVAPRETHMSLQDVEETYGPSKRQSSTFFPNHSSRHPWPRQSVVGRSIKSGPIPLGLPSPTGSTRGRTSDSSSTLVSMAMQ